MDTKETVAKILLKIGAVTLNTTTPFKYASGIFSPIYIDCRLISSFPRDRKIILNYFMEYINSNIGKEKFDIVVGSGHSGISLATFISEKLKLPMAYIRSSAKEHGKKNLIEGIVIKKQRVLLVSDIFGTEGHVENSVKVLKENGTKVIHVLSIFDLKLKNVPDFLKKRKVKFHTLTDLKTLSDVAYQAKEISKNEQKEIFNWLSNPVKWNNSRTRFTGKDFEKIKQDIAKELLAIKAVTLSPNEPYRYTSGILSPIYCDNRLWMSYPKQWEMLVNSMTNVIIHKIGLLNIDVIAGTSTAGISHASYLAGRLNLPLIYVKSKIEEHGKFTHIEGDLKPNQRVLLIEDLISTGGSSIACVDALRQAGGKVNQCMAIFTYEFAKSIENFANQNVTVIPLTNFSTLVEVAVENGYLKPSEKELVLAWKEDPENWGR